MPRNKSIRKSTIRKSNTRKSTTRKSTTRKSNTRKSYRRNRNIRGGGWAPWEGSTPNIGSNINYNRFQRVPFLSEMGAVDTIY